MSVKTVIMSQVKPDPTHTPNTTFPVGGRSDQPPVGEERWI